MKKNPYKTVKYYVRVCLVSKKDEKYITLGPFDEKKAKSMAEGYLSKGICSWIEKVAQ